MGWGGVLEMIAKEYGDFIWRQQKCFKTDCGDGCTTLSIRKNEEPFTYTS